MPVQPQPFTYSCSACRWSKTVAPRSDVLMPGVDHFDACPACGHRPLKTQTAGVTRATLAGLAEQIKHLLR